MILLYHKVALSAPTLWWVTADTFNRQMAALAAYDVVSLSSYDHSNPRHVVITFDGVYENVYFFALPILRKWGYPFELFITGNYLGRDNSFDTPEPRTRFCTIEQLETMTRYGGRIQWHTASHRRLDTLLEEEVLKEVSVPQEIRSRFPPPHFDWFAYPHGDHSELAVAAVQRNFRGALSCIAGNDNDRYQLNRVTVDEKTRLDKSRVTIIVANYNYGAFLSDAMESVLKQIMPPDEIILIDDFSTDGSREVARGYEHVARVVLNERNLGIVDNFNKAVSLATGDYIAFLGADNRMRTDYIERCKTALDRHPKAAIASTDMTIFGPRAAQLAANVGATLIGESSAERWPIYLWKFPDPTADVLATLESRNFMHGSSMYRRSAFDQVGGYCRSEGPEDHDLFKRMLKAGWDPIRVAGALIEYRQHSASQANTVLSLQREIAALRRCVMERSKHAEVQPDEQIAYLNRALVERDKAVAERDRAVALVNLMQQSNSWRFTRGLRFLARLMRYGLTNDDRQRLARALRNRYHRLPVPTPAKLLVSFVFHQVVHKAIRSFRRRALQVVQFKPPAVRPDSQRPEKWDYIVWGIIDWHFRHQRPQQLALALASTGRRVFYISPALIDDERAGFEVEAISPTEQSFQIKLFAKGALSIYSNAPSLEIVAQLRQSIGEVLAWADCKQLVSLIDHPFWHDIASVLPNSRLVYDCMDHHEGFGNNSESLLQLEKRLLSEAELTITTSAWLNEAVASHAAQSAVIRNAGDYAHFSVAPDRVYRDPEGRRVIGYYGAIAEWMDLDLVEAIARQHPDCCLLLIGADTVNAKARLSKLHNVTFTGEVPYGKLPHYLYGFDVCLLPFKVIPLTLATNPVKVYEYLSAGKPVVTVDLPEMAEFDGLVYVTAGKDAFLAAVYRVLSEPESDALIQRRKAFTQEQTWQHRAERLIHYAETTGRDPGVSVIVVTYNNLELTRACLWSLDEYSQYTQLEIIVVDNASADGSSAFLSEWVAAKSNRKLILNGENRGFAAANNQGLEEATGDYLVLLNNDTYVTSGWIRTLVRHLERDKTIGLIGPVTNNIGNEAKIDIAYDEMEDMLLKSAAYIRKHVGQTYPLRTAAFFCVMMSRATYERVGKLDEAFGRGFFEDDDYCRRIEQLGLRVVCAEDVFVHHHLSASFSKLKQEERQRLFEQNKVTYEAKWGEWLPHDYRRNQSITLYKPADVPAVFNGRKCFSGQCVICGRASRFFYSEVALWRESLNCEHCRSTSRYRSIARGLLRAISELTGVKTFSLATLPHSSDRRLTVYDTQPPFYYAACAYPLPDLLKKTGWIDLTLSQYKPHGKTGEIITGDITNQNLECLTYGDELLDIVITSDVMEHVRLDDRAHREIYRVLKPGGIYLFTVPNNRSWEETLARVQVNDPDDPTKDVHLLEPEYHGDTNNDGTGGVLAYRTYGKDLEAFLANLGFIIEYEYTRNETLGIMNTELFYCRKGSPSNPRVPVNVY